MSVKIAVVHEAAADFEMATELADRALRDVIDWLDEHLIDHQRMWLKESKSGQRLTWTGIKKLAAEAGIKVRGQFADNQPGLPDAKAALRAIRFLENEFEDLSAIMLIRDQDNEKERQDGLEQARRSHHKEVTIVVGLAIVERECWVLCGFDPVDDLETMRLGDERQNLGFDPRHRSQDLTACKNEHAKRSPKRVLRALSEGAMDRERSCWQETALATLRQRGAENGLAAFLREVQDKLATLIGHPREG